jgi:acyl-CoA thioester hydrolase
LITGYNVIYETPIAWGDMDAFAHVNNTVFFRLFESARMAYLGRINFTGATAAIGPILASTNCVFRRPIVYPDHVQVGARVIEVGHDRFTMEYTIVKSDGRVAAEGTGVIVSYDYKAQSKTPLPSEVREAIRAIDNV